MSHELNMDERGETGGGVPLTSGWQPMETAPKEPLNALGEGPRILTCSALGEMHVSHWKAGRVRAWRIVFTSYDPKPKWWQHRPEPPQ